MLDLSTFQERRDELADVATKDRSARIEIAIDRQSLGIAARFTFCRHPVEEIVGIIGDQAHARGRHIDTVRRIVRVIGEARAEARPRLEDDDGRAVACCVPREICSNRRPGEAAADDCDHGSARRSCHDWETFSFGR
ncbi:hypothetical protein D9M70_497600 [compost metagenome]